MQTKGNTNKLSRQGKGIKCYVSQVDYQRMQRMRERFGFASDYSLCSASLRVMLAMLERAAAGEQDQLPEEIQEAFEVLGNTEQYPLGRKPNRPDNSNYHLLFGDEPAREGYRVLRQASGIMGRKHGKLGEAVSKMNEDEVYRAKVKEWAGAFIESYGDALRKRVERMPRLARMDDGLEPLDILQETLLSLYECEEQFVTYVDFEAWAIQKFRSVLGR